MTAMSTIALSLTIQINDLKLAENATIFLDYILLSFVNLIWIWLCGGVDTSYGSV